MEFHHGRNNLQDSRGIPLEASCHSPFADQTYQVGYMGPDFRRNQHEVFFDHHQDPPVHPHPHHMHGGILREIEKEIITEEIIMADIARKRALEAEVRMIERKLTLLRRDRVLSFHPSPQMNHDLPTRLPLSVAEADWSSLEERLTALLEETKRMNGRHEILLPLQGGMKGLGNQETRCFYEVPKDDKKIIFLGEKSANISGSDNEKKKKKNRDEWSCALCKVSATSEETLNEHLNEKKHKLNIEALQRENDRKNYNIGLLPKTATKSSTIIKTLDQPAEQEAKITTEKHDLLLQAGYLAQQPEAKNNKNISASMKKDLAAFEVSSNELPRTDTKKNNIGQWSCGLCGICTTSEQDLNAHKLGKKHQLKLDDLRSENIRKNCCLPTKATDTLRIIKNVDQPAEQEVKLAPEYLLSKETKNAELSKTYSFLQSGNDTLQPEAKRDGTMYAWRETPLAPSQVGSNELPKTDTTNNYREQWTCVPCEITATREQDLNDHLHGNKHKLNLDALESKNARKICSLPNKVTKPNIIIKAVDPPADEAAKLTTEYFLSKETMKAYNKKQYPSSKSRVALSCALCKVSATSELALNAHLQGKKHKLKLDDLRSESVQKSCRDGIFQKKSDTMTGAVDSPGEPKSKLATRCFVVTGIKKADTRKQYLPLQPGDRTQQPEVKKGNACGIDGMALAAKEVASNELPKTDIAKKNDVNKWNCSLCEVSTTSEQGLNEHLQGKKHKLKLDHLKSESSQKQIGVEPLPMKVIKSTTMTETVDPPADQESKFETEYFLSKVTKKTDLSKQDSPLKDGYHTTQPEVNKGYASGIDGMALGAKEVAPNELPKTDNAKKNGVNKWNCTLCEVSATSELGLNGHLHGKKHKLKLDDLKSESAQRQIGVELLLMKVVKSDTMAETIDPPADQESKLGSECFLSKETKNTDLSKEDSPLKDGHQTLQPEVKKGHASGVDGMALAAKEVASNELLETDIAKKNDDGNKWDCSFCEGSTTSEHGLNEDLHGKKHMPKLDDLRSESCQKHIGGELLPKKTTESATMSETVNPPEDEESKHGTEYFLPNETIKTDLSKQDSPLKAGDQTLQPEDKKDVSPDQGGWFWRSLTNLQSRIMQKRVSETNGAVPCEVSNTGEQSLTEQLLGKHNPMLDILRSESAQENCSLHPPEPEPNLTTEYFLSKKTEEATLREQDSLLSPNPQVVNLKNETESALMAKKGDHGSEKYNFWCDLCRIGTLSQKNMVDHKKGKKHINLLKKKYQHCGDGPADIQKIHDFFDYDLCVSPGNKITPDSTDET